MSIIRQGSLFDLQDLYDLEPTQRYEAILSSIDVDSIVYQVGKKSWRGAPVELNYRAMIHSLIIRISEKIPTIKNQIRRLNYDFIFKLDCGFLVSDKIPSEAAYSRLISKLSDTNILEESNQKVIQQAIAEGYIMDDALPLMPHISRPVIKLLQRFTKKKKSPRKNAVENQRMKETNGLLKKLNTNPISHFIKRKLKPNLMYL